MTTPLPINALDPNALGDLKRLAKGNDPQAIEAAARQFESLFLGMVLKSMRAAVPAGGLFDNEQTKLYQSLLDQQLASDLAASGGAGLAKALIAQLGGTTPPNAAEISAGFDMASVTRRPANAAVVPMPPVDLAAPLAAPLASTRRATHRRADARSDLARRPQLCARVAAARAGGKPRNRDSRALHDRPGGARNGLG